MKRFLGCSLQTFFVFGGGFLGLLIGLQAPDAIHKGVLVGWEPFGLPGRERAVRFVEIDGPYIQVESTQGSHYVSPLSFDQVIAWYEVGPEGEAVDLPTPTGGGECRSDEPFRTNLIVRPVIARVVDRRYCWYSPHAEYYGDLQFVIDSGGKVRRWLRKDLGYGILGWYAICSVVGVTLGVVLSWLAYKAAAGFLPVSTQSVEESR
jgi:hypothetical protein